ncbi:hypothetical protein FRB96_002781 [Tulasnella sp. 330]|nr:hypothetical protein FRB96_002781 [Tulasnella sp. 330]
MDEDERRMIRAPTKTKRSKGKVVYTRKKWTPVEVHLACSVKEAWIEGRVGATGHTAKQINCFLRTRNAESEKAWEEIVDRIEATGIRRSRQGISLFTYNRLDRLMASK